MKKSLPVLTLCLAIGSSTFAADLVTHMPMEADMFGRFKETVGNTNLNYYGKHSAENVAGAVGDALRLDGYSSYVEGSVPAFNPAGASSFAIWVAPETYPSVVADGDSSNEKITVAGTINHDKKTGWAFSVNKFGNYSFDSYTGGWATNVEANDLLPRYEWSHLVAVNDPSSGVIILYRNGEKVGQAKSLGVLGNGDGMLTIGQTAGSQGAAFNYKAFNGLVDELRVFDGVISDSEISAAPENEADLSIPASRFEKDLLRPKFHGMPAANWTNECHGMTYSDGRYHLFFQKNANGPYMNRLHWGHISSENLYEWQEEPIALAPGESYDIKGCWSGAVFTDEEITGGKPYIIYTGVDYEKARIVLATPKDDSLIEWEKKGVIIDGKPAGLSDDFRDPYFFRNGKNAYIIVGTSKDGIGAVTLHKYNPATQTWSNDGKIFFKGTSEAAHGTFWEMPNVTPMGNGKWLFTCTPQKTSSDVHVLCWTGEISEDGVFTPDNEAYSDLEFINQIQGYGLLSPTISQKDGKTILLGIVPDKLPGNDNAALGWAHLYSFPREISLDEEGNLVQKPFEGLQQLRGTGFVAENVALDGARTIEGVSGRQFELKGEFTVGDNPFGFNFLKSGNGYASVSFIPAANRIEVNFSNLKNRKVNDNNSYNGKYVGVLPETIEKGSVMTLDVWADGSILDIFVNDKWASSVRVFPADSDNETAEVFSTGGVVNVKKVNGWNLSADAEGNGEGNGDGNNGIEEIIQDLPEYVNVYTVGGILVKKNVRSAEALMNLPKGIYIVGSHKIVL